MNIIEESFQTPEKKKKKIAIKIVLAAIIIVVIAIIRNCRLLSIASKCNIKSLS